MELKDIKTLVSIIIPVYNSEKYLLECVHSIMNQSYEYLEIIIINDGSTDNSLSCCYELQNEDKRIKVIDIENAGVSNARNIGIKESNGELLMFVDADDYIDKDFVFTLLSNCKNAYSLSLCGYYKVDKKKHEVNYFKSLKKIRNNKIYKTICRDSRIWNQVWNKIYIKDIIIKNNIFFNPEIKVGEDLLFNFQYAQFINEVIYISKPLYYYRCSPNSVMSTKHIDENIRLFDKLRSLSISKGFKKELIQTIKIYSILENFNIVCETNNAKYHSYFFHSAYKLILKRNIGKMIKLCVIKFYLSSFFKKEKV